MSGITEQTPRQAPSPIGADRLSEFKKLLSQRRDVDGRPMTIERLAIRVKTSRAHLSQVLSGNRCGKHTWKHLVDHLTAEELNVLRGTTKQEGESHEV